MILVWLQIILALGTIILIILQQPADEQGSQRSFFAPQIVRRGWEKITFNLTLFCIFGFIVVSFLRLMVENH
ncbi:MAG: hypothetical protein ABIB61_02740 [Candidatus Shapirobacteria bacterium]